MTEGVNSQEVAQPEKKASDKEFNFRRLEAEREKEREARIKAELEAQMRQKELEEIKEYLKPKEKDPFDDSDDVIDPELRSRIEAKLAKERSTFERKAEEIAKSTYERIQREKEEAEKKNYLQKLRGEFKDYDDVVSEQNLAVMFEKDPVFAEAALKIPDDYDRRKLVYARIKALGPQEEAPSVKDKVLENQKNPYHVPSGSAPTSNAVDYDLNTRESREAAYKRLKQAQRRPIEPRLTR